MKQIHEIDLEALMRGLGPITVEKCDSPIEDVFLWEYHKVANDRVALRRQYQCDIQLGSFRVDFVVTDPHRNRKIGVECDGRDFHDIARDAKRDAAIVAAGVLDKIYRLRGSDIHWRVHDTLQMLAMAEPWMFSDRGIEVLAALASPPHDHEDTWGYMRDTKQGGATRWFEQPDDPEDGEPSFRERVVLRWTPREQ
jgi:very-short-patch-repair endonuclease